MNRKHAALKESSCGVRLLSLCEAVCPTRLASTSPTSPQSLEKCVSSLFLPFHVQLEPRHSLVTENPSPGLCSPGNAELTKEQGFGLECTGD